MSLDLATDQTTNTEQENLNNIIRQLNNSLYTSQEM